MSKELMMLKMQYPDVRTEFLDDVCYIINILGEPESITDNNSWVRINYKNSHYVAMTSDKHRQYTGIHLSYYSNIDVLINKVQKGMIADDNT